MLARCLSLLRDTGNHLIAAAKKLHAMAYLVVIYMHFVWLDTLERRKSALNSKHKEPRAKVPEIHHVELLFDYDEQHAFSDDSAPPPITTYDITSQIEEQTTIFSEEESRANPFAKLESWHLIAERLLGEPCPLRRVRCEVRYTWGDAKYRRVLFLDDDAALDPGCLREASDPPARAHIIKASLCGSDAEIDVTSRVRRYLGPSGDWHGTKTLLARDLFPHDRHDNNSESFDCVRIVDGLACYHTVPYPDGPLPDFTSP